MLIRFAAAAVVASVAIAVGSLLIPFLLVFNPEGFCAVTRLWCAIPVVWGVWAMLTPRGWMPARLPHWGAILGLLLGLVALLIFNMPARAFFLRLPAEARIAGMFVLGGFYYLLWVLVRKVYESLAQLRDASEARTGSAAPSE